jgi:hypothetical protein
VILFATVLSVIMSFHSVSTMKTVSLHQLTAAASTHVSATSQSVTISVIAHVQRVTSDRSLMPAVVQLPSASHVNTQQLHSQRLHQQLLQLHQPPQHQQLQPLQLQDIISTQPHHTLQLFTQQHQQLKSAIVHMLPTLLTVQLHAHQVQSVTVTSVSAFWIVHVSTMATLTRLARPGRRIMVVLTASATPAALSAQLLLVKLPSASQATTSITPKVSVVQLVSRVIASALTRQLVTSILLVRLGLIATTSAMTAHVWRLAILFATDVLAMFQCQTVLPMRR